MSAEQEILREVELEVPYDFEPYPHANRLLNALEGGTKRACVAWHRRASKSLSIHAAWTVPQCFLVPGLYWHVFPTYGQGRKAAWESPTGLIDADGRPRNFRDFFPPQSIIRERDDEMMIWLEGGAIWQVVGSDKVDRLVGTNVRGVVFDEYALQRVAVWDYIEPILVENGGWAVFISTPRGHNHFHEMLVNAESQPKEWFSERLTIRDTRRRDGKPIVTEEQIEQLRKNGRAEEIIQQEFYVSFDVALEGSYYSQQMEQMRRDGRLGVVLHNPNLLVHTAWDLGFADNTAIWFFQIDHGRFMWIDCYQRKGEGAPHYAQVLADKRHQGNWVYGDHFMPHDAAQHEWGSGKTRLDTMRALGFKPRLVEREKLGDGIDLVRSMLTRSVMDVERCKVGVQALREYQRQEEGENARGDIEFGERPKRTWATHLADAIRTAACGVRPGMVNRTGHVIELPPRPRIAMA